MYTQRHNMHTQIHTQAENNHWNCPTVSHLSPAQTQFHDLAVIVQRHPLGMLCPRFPGHQPQTLALERPPCGKELPLPTTRGPLPAHA